MTMGAGLPLVTPRLTLRQVRIDDAIDFHKIYADPEVMQYWSSPPDPDTAYTTERVAEMANATSQSYLAIQKDGKAIGAAGVHQGCELGFILGRDHWQQGLMTEALEHLIPWLFQTFKYNHLTADADPKNEASVSTLLKVGFKETGRARGTYCVDGLWSDSVYFQRLP